MAELFCDTYCVSDEQRYSLNAKDAIIALRDSGRPKLCEVINADAEVHGYFDHEAYFASADSLPTPTIVYEHLASVLAGVFRTMRVVGAYRQTRATPKGTKISVRFWLPDCRASPKTWKAHAADLNAGRTLAELYGGLELPPINGKAQKPFDASIYHGNRKMNCVGKCKDDDPANRGYPLVPIDVAVPLEAYLIGFVSGTERAVDAPSSSTAKKTGKKRSVSPQELSGSTALSSTHKIPALSREFKELIGRQVTDLMWTHTALHKSHKLVPDTKHCVICAREHSSQKYCVFVNPTDVIRSCFSGGIETMEPREGREVIKQFNKLVLNVKVSEEDTAFRVLQEELWDEGDSLKLARERESGRIFERKVLPDGTSLEYAYIFREECGPFIERVLAEHPRLKSAVNNIKNMKVLLSTFPDARMPFLAENADLYGFRNGVLNIRTMEFTARSDCAAALPHGSVCRKYVDGDLDPQAAASAHPHFDAFLDRQMEPAVKEFLMMSMGRTFFRTNELDGWQFFCFLYGESGTGKSRIVDLLKFLHRKVETISRGYQASFGLKKLAEADIWLVDETPRNICDTFPQETFTAAVSGGLLEIGAKHVDAYTAPFTTPMLFAGNFFMNFVDKGQLQRRTAVIEFPHVLRPAEQDPNLPSLLEAEAPAILYHCLRLYHQYIERHGRQSVWDFAPSAIRESGTESRAANDPLFRFLSDETQVKFVEGAETPLIEVKRAFEAWLGKPVRSKLEHGTFAQVNPEWRVTRNALCKLCGNKHAAKPKCCELSDRSTKSVTPEIVIGLNIV
jgi:phage/plasmid-associated DNA primase